jgi:alkanesulfonate monooxygenase SsuD/methylene tetrahydromethanopterin reductase-like flavin-dependent oxidoreductase (luciferase family)
MATPHFGLLAWPQATAWAPYRDALVAADQAGWDSIWTWDHLLSITGGWDQSIFEGWTSLAAIAALTTNVRMGLMVGANTFRNPGLTAKLATTLDHISGGRAIVGLGGAWFEREHEAFGLEFGASVGQRLDWLDESVGLLRRLLDGELVTHDGEHYHFVDALCRPRPIQARMPILIGGSGPRKTLRTVALHADAWNMTGPLDRAVKSVQTLRDHCAAVGRDPAEIEMGVNIQVVVRDDPTEAERVWAEMMRTNGAPNATGMPRVLGSPAAVAEAMRPFVDLGFSHMNVRVPAPHDRETIERLGEIREQLGDLPAQGG